MPYVCMDEVLKDERASYEALAGYVCLLSVP